MQLIPIFSLILFMLLFITTMIKKEISQNKFIIINAFIIFLTICLMIYNIFNEYSDRLNNALFMGCTLNISVVNLITVWFKKIKILYLIPFIIFGIFVFVVINIIYS
ncbi:hypothetical protein KHQ81_14970 [Mycoplasmatota bacterium]|nr:hypothetical protein KHQ81_14970 [Mycoplasmatota bacterium]